MRTTRRLFAAVMLAGCIGLAGSASAQVSALPPDIQNFLDEVGPVWGKDLRSNVERTVATFQPLLKAAPKDGVTAVKNVHYGADPKQVLDIYHGAGLSNAPVVIFIHGGAYVRGDKDGYGEMYGNIATWFARQNTVAINATYRLAPGAPWPEAAKDVGGMVAWAKQNAATYGGDPNRIVLIGHSAGATHVASYIFDKRLQPESGPGVAGAVLVSGRYRLEYDAADPNAANMQAYFGKDGAAYADRSPITHIKGATTPVFIVVCEYENPGLDVRGAELFQAICERDGACPRFTRLARHNHLSEVAAFNTADEALGREILDFMKRGR